MGRDVNHCEAFPLVTVTRTEMRTVIRNYKSRTPPLSRVLHLPASHATRWQQR
ncbi:hypothetical protein PanWU01x14_064820, partial [Parasponia andersonii]